MLQWNRLVTCAGILSGFLTSGEAIAQVIERAEARHEGGKLSIVLRGQDLERLGNPRVREFDGFIQYEFPGAKVGDGLQLVRINDEVIKSVLLADLQGGVGARVRVTSANPGSMRRIQGQKAEIEAPSPQELRIEVPTQDLALQVARRLAEEPVVSGVGTDEGQQRPVLRSRTPSSESSVRSPEPEDATKAPAAVVPSAPAEPSQSIMKASESEIPIKAGAGQATMSAQGIDPIQRLTLTVVVVLAFLGVVYIGVRRYANAKLDARIANSDRIKIRIINRQSLGPKQGLAVVQVAGEVVLIGHTEHSISHLKTLALIDDELQDTREESLTPVAQATKGEQGQSAFARSLETQSESEDFAVAGLSEIRDRVTSKLKGMRMLE